MAAKTLGDFTLGTTSTIQTDDFIVGYDTAVAGGERRWTLSTVANAVSGLIKDEMQNYMNNTLTLGNYPYLEYACVTTPASAGQALAANSINTLILNTERADTGNFGTLSNSQVTLSAGTYQYNVHTVIFGGAGTSHPSDNYVGNVGIYNVTDSSYITINGHTSPNFQTGGCYNFSGQFTISSAKTIAIRSYTAYYAEVYNASYYYAAPSSGAGLTVGGDQRTTLKLWKVG